MSDRDRENFKEVIEIIPQIINASKMSLQREMETSNHEIERMKEERSRFKEVITFIQGKWTIDIIYIIFIRKNPSYNEIVNALPKINSRTLTDRLKMLENKEIIERLVMEKRPLRVKYKLTEFGESVVYMMIPIVLFLGWPELQK